MNDKPSEGNYSLNTRLGNAMGANITAPLQRRAPKIFLEQVVAPLIEARKARGLTQEQVNARLGAPDRLVAKWECGDRMPSGFLLWCWAAAVGFDWTLIARIDALEVQGGRNLRGRHPLPVEEAGGPVQRAKAA